ncbi:hypothetical protein MMC30_008415 [Trapelia coarctata]|nr:hypothetical protein [Trapelia coarctata]
MGQEGRTKRVQACKAADLGLQDGDEWGGLKDEDVCVHDVRWHDLERGDPEERSARPLPQTGRGRGLGVGGWGDYETTLARRGATAIYNAPPLQHVLGGQWAPDYLARTNAAKLHGQCRSRTTCQSGHACKGPTEVTPSGLGPHLTLALNTTTCQESLVVCSSIRAVSSIDMAPRTSPDGAVPMALSGRELCTPPPKTGPRVDASTR